MRHFFEYKCNKKGVALLEFAIVAPLFFGLVFNVTYAGLMLHDRHILSSIVYDKVRYLAANENQNISIMPDATGGAGLTISDAAKDMQDVFDKVNNQLFLYELEKNGDNVTDVQITITPHEGKKSTTEKTSSYVKVTVNDADVAMRVKAKLKEDAVPEIAALLCPNELDIKKEMRIEVHINKTLTVLGKEASGGGTSEEIEGSETPEIQGNSTVLGKNVTVAYNVPTEYNNDFTVNIKDSDSDNNTYNTFKPSDFDSFLYDMLDTDSYFKNIFFSDIYAGKFKQLLVDLETAGYFYNYDLDLFYHLYGANNSINKFVELMIRNMYADKFGLQDFNLKLNNSDIKILYIPKKAASEYADSELTKNKEISLQAYIIAKYTVTTSEGSEEYNIVFSKDYIEDNQGRIIKVDQLGTLQDATNGLTLIAGGEKNLPQEANWGKSVYEGFFKDNLATHEHLDGIYSLIKGNNYINIENSETVDKNQFGADMKLIQYDPDNGDIYLDVKDTNDASTLIKIEVNNPIRDSVASWQGVFFDNTGEISGVYTTIGNGYYQLDNIEDSIQDTNAKWNNGFWCDTNEGDDGNDGIYYRVSTKIAGQDNYFYRELENIDNPISPQSGIWSTFYVDRTDDVSKIFAKVDSNYYQLKNTDTNIRYNKDDWNKVNNIYTSKDPEITGSYILTNNRLYEIDSTPATKPASDWKSVIYDSTNTNEGAYVKIGDSYYKIKDDSKFIDAPLTGSTWSNGFVVDTSGTYKGTYVQRGTYATYYKVDLENGLSKSDKVMSKASFDANNAITGYTGLYTTYSSSYYKLDSSALTIKVSGSLTSGYVDVIPEHTKSSALYFGYNNSSLGTYNVVGTVVNGVNEYDYTLPAWQWDVLYNQQVK